MSEFTSHQEKELSLPELYEVAYKSFTQVMTEGRVRDDSTDIEDIEKAIDAVKREALFSKNEEMDDIHTSSIKYLYLRYFLGMVLSKNMKNRLEQLNNAKHHLNSYLEVCERLKVLHPDEVKAMNMTSEQLSAEERRRMKIEKYKRQKENKERVQRLNRLLILTKDDTEIDHEEEVRTAATLQLTVYAQEALDEINSIEQEIPIAIHMMEMEKHRELMKGKDEGRGTENVVTRMSEPPKRGEGPGLKVVRMNKVGDQITTKQEVIKANVFKSTVAPPTMTLDEFARLEMEGAMERQRRDEEQAQGSSENSDRRYHQLQADGDEDNIDVADKAIVKDREWDDWKDENPKGIGNKANKRY